jgi:hypothetical protein
MDRVSKIIDECSRLGVTFSLDDFGTGYSSLSYFKRLPADTLKIDQSFVRDMLRDTEDLAIVDGIIGLTEAFRRKVLAEGVETVDHGIALLCLGCDLAQGYGIAKPMPAIELNSWISSWQPNPLWTSLKRDRHGHDDIPLIFGKSFLRQWVERLQLELVGKHQVSTSEMEAPFRNFQSWYNGAGRVRYGALPEYAEIGERYRNAAELASELRSGLFLHLNMTLDQATDHFVDQVDTILRMLDELLISPGR